MQIVKLTRGIPRNSPTPKCLVRHKWRSSTLNYSYLTKFFMRKTSERTYLGKAVTFKNLPSISQIPLSIGSSSGYAFKCLIKNGDYAVLLG